MNLAKLRIWGLLTLVIFSAFCSGCEEKPKKTESGSVEESAPVKGGTYRRAFADSYLVLDPAFIMESNSHEIARQIYDGLVEFDGKAQIQPCIAESWSISPDKRVYTFKLRKDVHFHAEAGGRPTANGGRSVNADDVVYTFNRLMRPHDDSQASFFWVIKGARDVTNGKAAAVSGIKAITDDTVEFTLEKPFAPFVALLGMCNAFIVPREDCETASDSLIVRPVGTGPFYWQGKEEKTIKLAANEKYFRGRPWLDKIEISVIPDELERFQAFCDGKLDQVEVPDSQYKNVRQNPKHFGDLIETRMWGANYLGMNITKPPFDNKLVRQAMNYALDRDTIVNVVMNGRAEAANGVLPPGLMGHNENLPGYGYDIKKARRLLAQAGYPDGKGFPEIVLQYNFDENHARTAELILANLRDIGIKCSVKEIEFGDHLKQISLGKVPFFRMGWTLDYPDPDSMFYTIFHSSNVGVGYNFSRVVDKQLDDWLEQARNEIEPERRAQLYQKSEEFIVDLAPWLFLHFYTVNVLHQPYVHGIELGPMGEALVQYRHIYFSGK